MELSRTEYPALLSALPPAQAVAVLSARVKLVGKINSEIADWLQERRKVEEAYAQGLRKLARKQTIEDVSDLGVFQTPWQKLVGSAESLAASHQLLALKIELDVERPLREFVSKNREMQQMSTIQGNLAAMAKEIDGAKGKAEKLNKKGGKAAAGKVATATTDVETANSQWDSQAPFVFEKLQQVDESRCNILRDVLTQYQTHEVDQVERNRVSAEECLNTLLNIETADEIKTFATGVVEGKPRLERTSSSRTGVSSSLAPSTTPRPTDDGASLRSGNSGGAGGTGRLGVASEARHGSFSPLKRFSTVIRRARQSPVPYERASSPNKRSTDRFGHFGRSGSSKDVPPPPLPGTSSSSTRQERISSSPVVESPTSLGNGSAEMTGSPINDTLEPKSPPASLVPSLDPASRLEATNGTSLDEMRQIQEGPPTVPLLVLNENPKDSEGFSKPPPKLDAISRAEQEAASETPPPPQFKLDIRNDPIQEEDGDADAALANVANTLRAQATPLRKSGTVRGRRDVRNTVFIPSPPIDTMPVGSPDANSTFKVARAATLTSEDPIGSDTQSVRSGKSHSSLASSIIKHPEMHEPGLNTSIIETVSAWFDQGQITKAVVIGELAMAFNQGDISPPFGSEHIRLDNFPVLEKVAPNPSFITPITDKSGEYSVNLANIMRTTVAFKYQVHLEDSSLQSHAPIILSPIWRFEPSQASVILSYSFNPSFALSTRTSITLRNLTLLICLDASKPTACQSKPMGQFSKEKGHIFWPLGDVTLEAGATPGKVVGRFTTEHEAKPGAIEARWEISGEDAIGLGSGLRISQLSMGSAAPIETEIDPFADESAPVVSPNIEWKDIPTVRKLISGKYGVM
ncbi:MAG: hypothetical protein M1829_005455 [Trizodia sp. TS-e1964]|nr:MAG: hypothetical protein M1829_005455 [Trizodia sp. TS-e1964]